MQCYQRRDGKVSETNYFRPLFDGFLRVSEALGLRPKDIVQDENGCSVRITGRGRDGHVYVEYYEVYVEGISCNAGTSKGGGEDVRLLLHVTNIAPHFFPACI